MAESPFYRFFRRVDFPLPFRTWKKLPRLLTHKNEYWDGQVHLTPRPRTCDIYLDLERWPGPPPLSPEFAPKHPQPVVIRRLADDDWPAVTDAFYGAFAAQQPLVGWHQHAARRAARCIMDWTRLGRDGPLVRDACFVALSRGKQEDGPYNWACGAAVVTLASIGWMTGVPDQAAVPHPEQPDRWVVPHLDWVFVTRFMQRHGIGTMLLESVAHALRAGGFKYLASTCLLDNAPSLLWHWRNGFTLPPDAFTLRRARRVPDEASEPAP